jgi:hypothetical protein
VAPQCFRFDILHHEQCIVEPDVIEPELCACAGAGLKAEA